MTIIVISGSRDGWTPRQATAVRHLLKLWGATMLVHGDCVGVDAQADELARHMRLVRVAYPSDIESTRAHRERWGCEMLAEPQDPLVRNRHIVNLGDALIAIPRPSSRGTWHAVGCAKRLRRPCVVLSEDGVCYASKRSGNA